MDNREQRVEVKVGDGCPAIYPSVVIVNSDLCSIFLQLLCERAAKHVCVSDAECTHHLILNVTLIIQQFLETGCKNLEKDQQNMTPFNRQKLKNYFCHIIILGCLPLLESCQIARKQVLLFGFQNLTFLMSSIFVINNYFNKQDLHL